MTLMRAETGQNDRLVNQQDFNVSCQDVMKRLMKSSDSISDVLPAVYKSEKNVWVNEKKKKIKEMCNVMYILEGEGWLFTIT